jgi:hypothetical protein
MKKNTDKNKITKLISGILVVSIMAPSIFFSVPKKAEAAWWSTLHVDVEQGIQTALKWLSNKWDWINTDTNVTDTGLHFKDIAREIYKETLKAIAKRAIQEMTKSTINWINSGFHGQPLFLENPESFFRDIAKYEVKNMVDQFGYDSLKYPFGKDFALNAINSYKQTLENNTAYSLSRVINDPTLLHGYQNDFNVGGWNGFLINTQYPQNNYLGFQMTATEELARRVQGTSKTAVDKINDTLAQGQGFLSPQTCPSNPNYNNGKNEFQKPSFNQSDYDKKYNENFPWPAIDGKPTPEEQQKIEQYKNDYTTGLAAARAEWDSKNSCPGGLVNTTPGAIVASQIMNSLGSGQRQGELSAAMGNSLSAIFDALLNKFISDGLNSLASNSNPKNNPDTWSYDGQTLGSPGDGGTNSTWDIGPEEPIYINKFKKDIEDGINNTETELQLMSQINERLSEIWPKARTLDVCLPGPDVGWEQRLEDEKTRRGDNAIQKAITDASDKQEEEIDKVKKELKFAVDFFKDWITNKMMTELPSSILYMDAVKDVEVLSQGTNELADARRIKAQALVRLQSIQTSLDEIVQLDDEGKAIQPEQGSFEEEILIQLKKQFEATRTSISNTANVADRQNELLIKEEQSSNLDNLIIKCEEERTEKGWPDPAGLAINPEQAQFCDLPIIGGYTHGTFNGLSLTHPELPMVNAQKVLKYKKLTLGSLLTFSKKTAWVNIKLSCNNIYNATILDYKGNLPGPTTTEPYTPSGPDLGDAGEILGSCEFDDGMEITVDDDVTEEYCNDNGGSWTQNEEVTP